MHGSRSRRRAQCTHTLPRTYPMPYQRAHVPPSPHTGTALPRSFSPNALKGAPPGGWDCAGPREDSNGRAHSLHVRQPGTFLPSPFCFPPGERVQLVQLPLPCRFTSSAQGPWGEFYLICEQGNGSEHARLGSACILGTSLHSQHAVLLCNPCPKSCLGGLPHWEACPPASQHSPAGWGSLPQPKFP